MEEIKTNDGVQKYYVDNVSLKYLFSKNLAYNTTCILRVFIYMIT